MHPAYRNLLIFLCMKFGLMYLMRLWIQQNIREMEKRGIRIPINPR